MDTEISITTYLFDKDGRVWSRTEATEYGQKVYKIGKAPQFWALDYPNLKSPITANKARKYGPFRLAVPTTEVVV